MQCHLALYMFRKISPKILEFILRGILGSILECDVLVSEFELQALYYVYFQTNNSSKVGNSYPSSTHQFWVR